MSVSMRSTKAQMYSEIERLRDLLDRREQQARLTTKTSHVRSTKRSASATNCVLSAKPPMSPSAARGTS